MQTKVLFLLCVAALQACAGTPSPTPMSWTMYQRDPSHQGIVRSSFPAVSWMRPVGSKVNGGLAYDGIRLYAPDFAHELLALDPKTGSVLWRAHADDVVMSTPIVAEGMVFVGTGTNNILSDHGAHAFWGRRQGNHIYAFATDTGRQIWSYRVPGEAMPSAAYADGKLVFATGDNLATALDARTGKVIWSVRVPGWVSMASAMVANDTFYLTATRGKALYADPARSHTLALRLDDGKRLWSVAYGTADCTPTIGEGLVFVENEVDGPLGPHEAVGTNEVAALDEHTGALRWRYRSAVGVYTDVGSNERSIAGTYAGGVLYQSIPAVGALAAFRARDGRMLWTIHTAGPVKMSPIVYDGNVYFGDTAGVLYKLDARTGAVRDAYPYERPFTTAPPIIVGETLFIPNTDALFAIALNRL
jgi:outer membrane protein assembly factor BamB